MLITYFVIPQKMYSPYIGEYKTYNIAAYGRMYLPPVAVVRDIFTDVEPVARRVRLFQAYDLDPIPLKDAVLDMRE